MLFPLAKCAASSEGYLTQLVAPSSIKLSYEVLENREEHGQRVVDSTVTSRGSTPVPPLVSTQRAPRFTAAMIASAMISCSSGITVTSVSVKTASENSC